MIIDFSLRFEMLGMTPITCVSKIPGENLKSRILPDGVTNISWKGTGTRFNPWETVSYVLSLKKVLQEVKPDLLHAGPIQSVGFVSALSGFHPLVSMSWGFDLMQHADRSAWSRWVTRNVLSKSDWLFGDCKAVLKKRIIMVMI